MGNMPIFAAENQSFQGIAMIERNIIHELRRWSGKRNRKPLVIRGARQVGKTTVVKQFAREFDAHVILNLELESDRAYFQSASTPAEVMEILYLTKLKGYPPDSSKRVLLFIDEIQSMPKVIGMLRYFYEDMPQLYVIAAGSRLQELFKTGVSFPVGRVEYMTMRPCFFDEYLDGVGELPLKQYLGQKDIPESIHNLLIRQFQQYALVGGMPEVVMEYADAKSVSQLAPLYKGLLQSYDEDVEKYASTAAKVATLRHILRYGWQYAGQTVSFARIGGGSFNSKVVHQAMELLERAFIVSLDYPTSTVTPPLQAALSKFPKYIWLDSGLVNFSAGIQVEYLSNKSLTDVWRGHAVEQIVGQELWQVLDRNYIDSQSFWAKDKAGSTAEIDFILPVDGRLIPVEVKSGANAHLRSLQSYMSVPGASDIAVRVWPGRYSVDEITNVYTQKTFKLINVPFYCVGRLDEIIRSNM